MIGIYVHDLRVCMYDLYVRCVCAHVYCLRAYVCMHACIRTYVCMHASMLVITNTCIFAFYMFTTTRTIYLLSQNAIPMHHASRACSHTQIHSHIQRQVNAHTHKHTHTHTHTHSCADIHNVNVWARAESTTLGRPIPTSTDSSAVQSLRRNKRR